MARTPDFARYLAACDYPGTIDPPRVTECLSGYLRALGAQYRIRQLPDGWSLASEDSLRRTVRDVLLAFAEKRGLPVHVYASAAFEPLTATNARDVCDAKDINRRIAIAGREARNVRRALIAHNAREARATGDAREARDAYVVMDALATREVANARGILAAHDACETREAFHAQEALEARSALAPWGPRTRDTLTTLIPRGAHDARDALAALTPRGASDARTALAALTTPETRDVREILDTSLARFASWCLHRGWSWWNWDLSWMSTIWLGVQQLGYDIAWARPLFEAYIAGAWFLFWGDDTLYWIAKPVLCVESFPGGQRLHCADGPALKSDAENLYFWHGVLVPAFVIMRPDWITLDHIHHENNAEVRRVMLDRYGLDRFVQDTGARPISVDDCGTLYRIEHAKGTDEPLVVVRVRNSTVEPDGTSRSFMLRVDPTLRPLPPGEWAASRKLEWIERQRPQALTARNAVASLHGLRGEEYGPVVET